MSTESFGLRHSPISPKSLAQGIRLGDSAWDSDGKTLVWLEGRSDRGVLVCSKLDGNGPRDLTDELNVRARVGYGGGDFTVAHGKVCFVSGGRLYRQDLAGGQAQAITPAFGDIAAPAISPDGRWVLYVYSYERNDGVAVADLDGKLWPQIIACGRDFYMQPRWCPDGKHAAWISWNHPQMPWDGTELTLAKLEQPARGLPFATETKTVAGSERIAVFQPEFSPDGKHLSWLSDETGWHNLHLLNIASGECVRATNENAAQLGDPAWSQGQRTYGWSRNSKKIYITRNEHGVYALTALDVDSKKLSEVPALDGYTSLMQPALNPAHDTIALVASSGTASARLMVQELATKAAPTIIKRATSETIPAAELIQPKAITWNTKAGAIHGLLYLPKGEGAAQQRPPAIIKIHGGPTSQARAAYSGEAQFFATRGYTFLDVNYRGSTGYGRKYMDELCGNWGICDVEDAISGAKHLIEQGHADAGKLVVMGGSAGGFTVLQSLCNHPKFFKAGVCLYGVSNQFTLASDTHKFEERYTDYLLGPLPEAAALYRERSPVFHAEKIVDPIAIFQGAIDEIVPRAQSDTVVESLKRRNVPHEYYVYEGEGHGWRKSETIEAYYKSVEAFLKTHVLFA